MTKLRPWLGRVVLVSLSLCISPLATAQDAEALSARFRDAARAVQPSVVGIEGTVTSVPPRVMAPTRIRVPGVDITAPGPIVQGAPEIDRQTGSGLVVDAQKGLILTADHVVAYSEDLVVTLPSGEQRPVVSIVRDPQSDLALLTIAPAGLSAAAWGNSELLDLGDWVITVGSPFGLTGTITAGIVSGRARSIHERRFEDLIQTDASVYPGSSGGPLVNLRGEVVGIVIAWQGDPDRERGPGFAIPSKRARRVAMDLAEFGHVRRAYLGVRLEESAPGQVLVTAVEPNTPASAAGLLPGDLILKVNNRPVTSSGEVQAVVEFAEIGQPLTLSVRRGETVVELPVSPSERPVVAPAPTPDFIRPGSLDLQPRPVRVHR